MSSQVPTQRDWSLRLDEYRGQLAMAGRPRDKPLIAGTEKTRPNLRDVHTDKTKVKAPTTVATPLQESKSRNKPETAGKTGSFGRKRGIRAGVGLISAKGQQGLSWMQKHAGELRSCSLECLFCSATLIISLFSVLS